MNDHPEIPSDEPAIGLSFRVPLDETGREVVFQSHVSADCSEAHLNGLLDKLSRAGERQKAKVLIPTYQNALDIKKEALAKETNELFMACSERDTQLEIWRRASSESGRRSWKPSPAQQLDHVKIEARIKQAEQNIKILNKQIDSEESRLSIYKDRLGAEV